MGYDMVRRDENLECREKLLDWIFGAKVKVGGSPDGCWRRKRQERKRVIVISK